MNELESLRDAARGLIAKDPSWERLCAEVGVSGLVIPERFDGAGAGMAEACVVLEEFGRVLSPAPTLSTLLATQALLLAGNDEACSRLLPGVSAGTHRIALAWPDDIALDAVEADTVLVAGEGSLFELDQVSVDPVVGMDLTRSFGRVAAAGHTRLGPFDSDRMRDIACLALAAEQVGAMERALEITVEYAKTRVQFGRPIGGFQAIQHRLADLYVLTETARSAYLSALDGSSESATVARVYCTEAFLRVAAEMIQIHGGIAITWEHDAHRYFKRAHGSAELYGHPRTHIARLGEIILSGGAT